MITIIYSTHKDENYNNKFKQHLLQSSGLKDVQILEYQNNNQYSLAEVYNKGISESKFNIVVCCHNDIKLEKDWGKKLLRDFEDNPDFGIIGKAGTCYFPESGVYWERMNETMVGQVYHHPEGQNKWLSTYSVKIPEIIPVVSIDGLFISFNKNKVTHLFDETIGRFHFYDHLFCIPNYLDGVKIGVTFSFDITHQSVGMPNQEFFDSKSKFLDKYSLYLPIDLKPSKIYVPKIQTKYVKNRGKVAVIIPTKGKVEMLYECVKSFYEHCSTEIFTIFIADTGSSNEEKDFIKSEILSLGDIRLIEYDYYNFAKINNDVVKNHVDNNFEFLLFCNNDIKLLNNVISGMLNVFKEKPNAGTVGCRLHFENNTVQHDGILAYLDSNNHFQVSHFGLFGYYTYSNNVREVFGNTAALMMIRKNTFIKCNMFNENYINCFEDVELNMSCVVNNLTNYCDGKLVAYHYESQTRNEDPKKMEKLISDYRNTLFPYFVKHYEKVKKKLSFLKK